MASAQEVNDLKKTLRREVSLFCTSKTAQWKEPVRQALVDLGRAGLSAVLFGGAPRSLLCSRLYLGRPGRPRDIDIVVRDAKIDDLYGVFGKVIRETRFGGLKVQKSVWSFDMWPLDRTWMFSQDRTENPQFADLPSTTAFNLEAVAIEVWPQKTGLPRIVFAGDDQFFHGIADRLLELNRPENPFPELTVVRALLLSHGLGFDIGPNLASYIAETGQKISDGEWEPLQRHHYGIARLDGGTLRQYVDFVRSRLEMNPAARIRLPANKQLALFEYQSEPEIHFMSLVG